MSNIPFDTKENKGLVWNLMNETGVFKGIPDVYIDQVKRDYENKINYIKSNIQPKDTLTTLNKRVLSEMMVDMTKYRNVGLAPSSIGNSVSSRVSTQTPLSVSVPIPVTAKDVSTQRQQKFNDVLEKKKEEFVNLFGNKPPSTIDFSDKLDKPIGSEMEQMIAATIARRNNDLNIVLDKQDTTTAAKWINSENGNSNTGTGNGNGNTNNLIKIGQNTMLDNNSIIDVTKSNTRTSNDTSNKKQVRFTELPPTSIAIAIENENDSENDNYNNNIDIESDNDVSTFLSILNNKTENDNDIIIDNNNTVVGIDVFLDNMYNKMKMLLEERLSKIEETQREILSLLQVKNNTNNNKSVLDEDISATDVVNARDT
jgi:hypothetical protein